jgi:hypothetical protein
MIIVQTGIECGNSTGSIISTTGIIPTIADVSPDFAATILTTEACATMDNDDLVATLVVRDEHVGITSASAA